MARPIVIKEGEDITKCNICGTPIIYDPTTDSRVVGGFDNFTPIRRVIMCPVCHHDTDVR